LRAAGGGFEHANHLAFDLLDDAGVSAPCHPIAGPQHDPRRPVPGPPLQRTAEGAT